MSDAQKALKIVVDMSEAKAQVDAFDKRLNNLGKGSSAGMNQAGGSIEKAAKAMAGGEKAASGLGKSFSAANDNLKPFMGSLGGLADRAKSATGAFPGLVSQLGGLRGVAIGGAVAIVGVVAAIGLLSGPVIAASTKVESMKASLTTITGDAQKAAGAFDALAAYAAKTPFSLDQAVNGFVKLSALGLTPSERALTSYGNTSAAMGKDLNQMVEAVADATTGEFERLKEFGIKSKTEGDKVAFTFAGVTTTVGKNATEIENYLMKIGETKFAGAMDRQAKTIGGTMSELKDNITLAFAELGEGGMSKAFSGIFTMISNGVKTVTPLLGGIGNALGGIISIAGALLGGVGDLFTGINTGANGSTTLLETVTVAFNLIGHGAQIVGAIITTVFQSIGTVIGWVVGFAQTIFGALWSWLPAASETSTRSVGNKFIGILRAVKYVAVNIPAFFKTAFASVGNIFGILGARIVAFFKGNFNAFDGFGAAVSAQIAAAGKAGADLMEGAAKIYGDEKGADAAWDRMRGRKPPAGSIDDYAGKAKRSPAAANDNKKDAEAKKAKELLEQRAKAEYEFWQSMEQQRDTAQLIGLELQKQNKELELRKVLNDGDLRNARDLNEEQKKRIADLLIETNTRSILKSLEEKTTDAKALGAKLEREKTVLSTMSLKDAETQLAVDEALADVRKKMAEDGVKADDARVAAALALVEAETRANIERQRGIELLRGQASEGEKLIEDAFKRKNPAATALAEKLARDKAIGSAQRPSEMSDAEWQKRVKIALLSSADDYKDAMKDIADKFRNEMVSAVRNLGDQIGGKVGSFINKLSNVLDSVSKGTDPNSGLGKSLNSVFGQGSKFMETLGKMGGGAETGKEIAGLAKAIGFKKFSTTGAQIGGAIGSFLPIPGGEIIGSVIGGTIGSFFKKAKTGSSTIELGADGNLSADKLTGNNKKMKEAAGSAGEAVVSTLYDIASRLGGDLTGNPSVSIGLKDGQWRVDTSGQGNVKTRKGAIDFGKDGADEAIMFAIRDAIKDGVITGLSSFSDRLIRSAKNLDSAISLAESYEGVLKELAKLDDPFKASIKEVTTNLDKMLDMMRKAGATTAELADVERYRKLRLDDLLKNELSSLNEFRATLTGAGSGVMATTRLRGMLTDFEKYQTDIGSGKTVNTDAFLSLGQEIFQLSSDIYGTSGGRGQSIRQMLLDATDGLIQNTQQAFDDATVVAITQQTAAITQGQAIANDLAQQQLVATQQLLSAINNGTFGGFAINGQYMTDRA